jgi:hypothetical protein
MYFIVQFIQVGTEKKFRYDVVFGPAGLWHVNRAADNLTGFAPTNSFIELKVRGRETTCCPSSCIPGKQRSARAHAADVIDQVRPIRCHELDAERGALPRTKVGQ